MQDVNENDYENLTAELAKESFKGEKNAAKSKAYNAEKGSFGKEGNVTMQQVNDALIRVLSKTGKNISTLS